MVEFAMVAPVLFALIFAGIDFGGYFASRLSVENAARVAVRAAAVETCPTSGVGFSSAGNPSTCWTNAASPGAGTIEQVAIAAAGDANIKNVDCPDSDLVWPPSAADLATLTPGTGCISIAYFYLTASAQSVCATWSVTNDKMTTTALYPADCPITASATGADVVQVVIGYNYAPLIPIPWFKGAGLTTTSAASQLILEQG
jgi:hypothetical protein